MSDHGESRSPTEPGMGKSNKSPKVRFLASKKHKLSKNKAGKVPTVAPGSVPRYMTDSKRSKLERIRDASNLQAKRDRMKNIIVKKMTGRFGMRQLVLIESFVDEFVSNNAGKPITSSGLAALEKELAEIINFKKPSVKKIPTPPEPATDEVEVKRDQSHLKLPPGVAWKAINAYQAALAEREEKEERTLEAKKKSRLRRELEVQMEAAKKVHQAEREADVNFAQHVMSDVERYKMQEDAKQREMERKAEVQRKFREEQIADQAARKRAELDAIRSDEQRRIERIQAEIDAEKRMLEEKKEAQRARQHQVKLENEALRLHRIEVKRQEVEEDQRLMAEYAAKMDREAAEREQAFAKRMQTMEKYAAKFNDEGAGKVQREEMLREERLLLAEQERKEKADKAEELRRRNLQKSKLEAAQKANIEMMRQKALQAEEDRRNDERIAQMTEKEVQAYKKQEAERVRRLAEQKFRFRSNLDQQMQEKDRVQQLGDMSSMEQVINKSTLDAIEHSDKEIRDAIRRKLKI